MKNRIKLIRKHAGLNQTEFGARIGAKQSTIGAYECGAREPMDVTIRALCREFHVNELWLRTGEGEPFAEKDRRQQVAEVLGQAAVGDTLKDRQIRAFAMLPDQAYQALADWAENYARENGWLPEE